MELGRVKTENPYDQRLYCMYRLANPLKKRKAKGEKDDSKEKLYKGQRGNANV